MRVVPLKFELSNRKYNFADLNYTDKLPMDWTFMSLEDCKLIELPKNSDPRGNI